MPSIEDDHMADAARQEAEWHERGLTDPEPSLGSRFGQIGVLGWMIVAPMLLGLLAGRWLDRRMATGITMTAALLLVGAVIGSWSAWKWMHKGL
jgi:ATP synthase protein I